MPAPDPSHSAAIGRPTMNAGDSTDRRPSPAASADKGKKAIRAGVFAYFIDQFDIYLPIVVLAPATQFFQPAGIPAGTAAILSAFVFASTLIGRPLGAAVFGHLADTIGRRKSTLIAVGGFSVTTLVIALLPGYASIGLWSIGLLLALRFIDGFFLGGEYTAAVPLAMEWSPKKRRGSISGLITFTSPGASALIAAITLLLLNLIPSGGPASPYSQLGWRIPFIVGAILGAVLFRQYLKEVEDEPAVAKAIHVHRRSPLLELFSSAHRRSLVQVLILMTGAWLAANVALAVLPGQLQSIAKLKSVDSTIVMLVLAAAAAISYPALGALSQRIGRRPYFAGYGIVLAVAGSASYALVLQFGHSLLAAVVIAAFIGPLTIGTFAPIAAYLTERFPASIRASGYGVGYSLAIVIPAFYAFYMSGLSAAFSAQVAPVILLVVSGAFISLGGFLGPETKDVSMGAEAAREAID